ncbi:MAG: hypothetical protein JNL39_08525 [Opitutaceae bacterium]|nr:hypothetical protein [Opitutaceae bacterium]
MKSLLLCLLPVMAVGASAPQTTPEPKVGESWTYNTRPGEESSFLVVRKIETIPGLGEVAHISLFKLRLAGPGLLPGQHVETVGHLPIALASLRASLREKVSRYYPGIDWDGGYQTWMAASKKAGGMGIYTEPVSSCVAILEKALLRGSVSR